MELRRVIRQRHMVRSFSEQAVDVGVIESLLACALRAPSAGNTKGTAWVVLEGKEETGIYWQNATTEDWRSSSPRWPGLSRAPVIFLSLCSPEAYLSRYAEEDKSGALEPAGLSEGESSWPVPYWFGDASFATMLLLLSVQDAGLGAAFLGNFRGEAALLEALGVPPGWRFFGAVLIGQSDGMDHRSASLDRVGPTDSDRTHRGRWDESRLKRDSLDGTVQALGQPPRGSHG